MNNDEEIKIASPDIPIDIDYPITIYISCGDRPHEANIAEWLKERLEVNGDHVEVHWWGTRSPGSMGGIGHTSKIQSNIESSDLFIGILHRRQSLGRGKYYTSQATREEMIWAQASAKWQNGKPFFCAFRQEDVLLDGMMIQRHEVRKIKDSDEIIKFLKQAILELKQYKEKFPLTEDITKELKGIGDEAIAGIRAEQYDHVKLQLELLEKKFPFHDTSFKGVSHRILEEIANEASVYFPRIIGYIIDIYDGAANIYEEVNGLLNEKKINHILSILTVIKFNLLRFHPDEKELILQVDELLSRYAMIFKDGGDTVIFNRFALIAKEDDYLKIFQT